MTSSRFLTGLMVIAVAPLALASGPVEAQVSNYADGAVTIDLGVLPGGGYGYAVDVSSEPSAPAYGGGLRLPGASRPTSQLFVAPEKSAPIRKPQVTRAEPAPAPRASRMETAMRPPAVKAPPPPMPSKPSPAPVAAADAPAPLTAAPPPPALPTDPGKTADKKMADAAPPPAPKADAMTAAADKAPPPPPPATAPGAAVPPPPPPPATATAVPTPPAPKSESMASLTTGEDGRLTRVVFDESQSKLPDSAKPNLLKLAEQVKDQRDVRLQLLAYAGGDDLKSNRARRLSLSRALSVRSFLIESGIRSTRIDVRALGDKTTDEPKNRVDITLAPR
jgi:outer membrane protein OmpA-like peptidoglycan-associated protein